MVSLKPLCVMGVAFLHSKGIYRLPCTILGLLWWLSGKESTCSAGDEGDLGLIPGSGGSPE